jgi:hypothetical protein
MKENKLYYTPVIEEFHVGFEYQTTDLGDDGVSTVWRDQVFEGEEIRTYFIEELNNEEHRVKFLDKEDIESFGFTVTHYNEVSIYGKVGGYQPYTIENFSLVENHIFEIKWQSSMGDVTLFRGIIKNKSEFSKLLKQLNIDL